MRRVGFSYRAMYRARQALGVTFRRAGGCTVYELPADGVEKAAWLPSGHVFTCSRGRPWTRVAITQKFRRLREEVGLPDDCRINGLRHFFATWAIKHNVALKAVATLLGHTRTEMTIFNEGDPAAFSLDDAGMRARVKSVAGANADTLIEVYRKDNPRATPSDIYFLIASDYRYGAPVMKIAERRAALGKGPTYLYVFAWETPVMNLLSPHTMEIPFVFDHIELCESMVGAISPPMHELEAATAGAWAEFKNLLHRLRLYRWRNCAWPAPIRECCSNIVFGEPLRGHSELPAGSMTSARR